MRLQRVTEDGASHGDPLALPRLDSLVRQQRERCDR